MNIDNFLEWQRKQGHKVFQTASSYWYEAGPRVLQAFPYDCLINPSEEEIISLLTKYGIFAIRYSSPLDVLNGKLSYHCILNSPYDLTFVHNKARKQVVKGLSQCVIKQISLNCLAKDCWNLQAETLARQGRCKFMCQADWENLCLTASGIDGFQAWGTFFEDKAVAALFTFQTQEICYFLYSLSLQHYLNYYVNHALFYFVIQEKLQQNGIKQIFCTVQSLDASEQVDEFKFRMGFQPRIVRQKVVFHPLLKPIVNKFSYRIIDVFHHINPKNNFLAKGEGMFRFYLEGRLPLEKQELPKRLLHYKEDLIGEKSH